MQKHDIVEVVKEHPVETVAVVATVSLIGVLFYHHQQKKAYELELAKYRAMRPPWWSYLIPSRRRQKHQLTIVA